MDRKSVDMWRPATPLTHLRATDDRLFLVSDDELVAVAAESKRVQWRFDVGRAELMHAPVSNGDLLFVGDDEGALHALDVASGSEAWTFRADHSIYGAPAVDGDDLFVGSHDGRVYALNAADGRQRWRFEAGGGISSTPTLTDDTVYVGGDSHAVYALRRRGGIERWRYEARAPVEVAPIVVGDVLYVGSHSGSLHVVDRQSGTSRTMHPLERSPCRGMVCAGETLVVVAGDTAFGFDTAARGFDTAWRAQFGGELGVPVAASDAVYCVTYDGVVAELDRSTGRLNWEFDTERPVYAAPTPAGDTLYVGSEEGYLYTFPVGKSGGETSLYVPEGDGTHPDRAAEAASASGSSETEIFAESAGGDAGSETRYCSACGTPVDPGDRFCSYCGEDL